MIGKLKRTTADRPITDGETFAAGAIAVATPGHSVGHMSPYLPSSKNLIVGDAMVADNGTLAGSVEMATPDMPALESLKKFLAHRLRRSQIRY